MTAAVKILLALLSLSGYNKIKMLSTTATTPIVAQSISRSVTERLQKGRFVAQVLSVFNQACNLIEREGDVLALVTPQAGDGPINIVVDGKAGMFVEIRPGVSVKLRGDRLVAAGLQIDLAGAAVWEPRPDWDTLRARRAAITSHLPLLRALGLRRAPDCGLLAIFGTPRSRDRLTETVVSAARKAAVALREGWGGDSARLQGGAAGLAGLGEGLTPAGDDFLVGTMLWAWLTHPAPDGICRAIAQVAVPRTTTLSAALLRAAASGECSAAWHMLLAAISAGGESKITAAVREILAHGATSGADGLAGFLFMGIETARALPQLPGVVDAAVATAAGANRTTACLRTDTVVRMQTGIDLDSRKTTTGE